MTTPSPEALDYAKREMCEQWRVEQLHPYGSRTVHPDPCPRCATIAADLDEFAAGAVERFTERLIEVCHEDENPMMAACVHHAIAKAKAAALPPGCSCDAMTWGNPENIPPACSEFVPMVGEDSYCKTCEHNAECHNKAMGEP